MSLLGPARVRPPFPDLGAAMAKAGELSAGDVDGHRVAPTYRVMERDAGRMYGGGEACYDGCSRDDDGWETLRFGVEQ